MRLVDEANILKIKINRIGKAIISKQQRPSQQEIIETAYWARCVLEVIKDVDFQKYGHIIPANFRIAEGIDDPERPGFGKFIYANNKSIPVERLLGVIIHHRYFSFGFQADGNHFLDVMSDRKIRYWIFYADFIAAVRSLVLTDELVAAAVCDLADRELLRQDPNGWRYEESIFSSVNLFWLLQEYVKDRFQLKAKIMDRIFGISEVPDDVLRNLGFFINVEGPSRLLKMGFTPSWEDRQNVFSPSFDRDLLFNMIRQ